MGLRPAGRRGPPGRLSGLGKSQSASATGKPDPGPALNHSRPLLCPNRHSPSAPHGDSARGYEYCTQHLEA